MAAEAAVAAAAEVEHWPHVVIVDAIRMHVFNAGPLTRGACWPSTCPQHRAALQHAHTATSAHDTASASGRHCTCSHITHLTRCRHSCVRSPPNVFSPLYLMYRKPSLSFISSYTADIRDAEGGSLLSIKMKMARSGLSLMRFRMTYTNCPTVKSAGTRYFFLSMSGMELLFSARSTITGIRSGYFSLMRAASAWRFSSGCSSLNDRGFVVAMAAEGLAAAYAEGLW
mmetsp:Transcript_46592/g.101467  ORF Transcript_46592/g.101467 Transcript_46592/m.101467 type:complete len:227 (+) Transcript_46592:646-1326(+)